MPRISLYTCDPLMPRFAGAGKAQKIRIPYESYQSSHGAKKDKERLIENRLAVTKGIA